MMVVLKKNDQLTKFLQSVGRTQMREPNSIAINQINQSNSWHISIWTKLDQLTCQHGVPLKKINYKCLLVITLTYYVSCSFVVYSSATLDRMQSAWSCNLALVSQDPKAFRQPWLCHLQSSNNLALINVCFRLYFALCVCKNSICAESIWIDF